MDRVDLVDRVLERVDGPSALELLASLTDGVFDRDRGSDDGKG
jgi:hypothetical protein